MKKRDSIDTTSTTYAVFNPWTTPVLVDTIILEGSIELIYTRWSTTWGPSADQCYKVVYSCVDGKWNVSEPIFGEIIPATEEAYEFEGQPV